MGMKTAAVLLSTFLALATVTSAAIHRGQLRSKAGTGFGFDNVTDLAAMSQEGLSWWYNWGTEPSAEAGEYSKQHGIEFLPMQWSKWGIEGLLGSRSLQEATALLGYNEPNHREQANLDPAEAASLWPYLMEAAEKYNLHLGAPSAAPCGADCIIASPFDWWDQFFGLCRGCTFDFLAVHIYSCNGDAVGWFIEEAKQRYGLPIWVTEFACPSGPGPHAVSQQLFMAAALEKLEADPWIEAYAWFAPRVGDQWVGESASLLRPHAAELTELGRSYLSPQSQPPVAGGASLARNASAAASLARNISAAAKGTWSVMCEACLDTGRLGACKAGGCLTDQASRDPFCCRCQDCGFWSRQTLNPELPPGLRLLEPAAAGKDSRSA